jgi:hypothetical protein
MTHEVETIDRIPNDVIVHIIRNAKNYTWNFFAIKILLIRLDLKIKMHHNNQSILPECCNELRNLLKKSFNIPNSQEDLKQILSIT